MTYHLVRKQVIERPVDEVFAFFGDAFNLERITPPFLRFKVLTPPPIEMRPGTLLDYRLSLFGIRFGWRTLIEEWVPNKRFVDTQLEGPYAVWRHTHTFTPLAPNRTRMNDRVDYVLGRGRLDPLVHPVFVRPSLNRIFDHRARTIAEIFPPK